MKTKLAVIVGAAGLVASPTPNGHAQPNGDGLEARLLNASPYSIHADDELDAFVRQRARAVIDEHCAACHGARLEGRPGVPSLVDFDWLWGITGAETNDVGPVMEIQQTILYGVRNTDCPDIEDVSYYGACADTRFSQMPGYRALQVFDDQEIDELTEYVLALSGQDHDTGAAARGEALWPICTECHGSDGAGYPPFGGPNLTDDVWLFGGDRTTVRNVIADGRTETCPAWSTTLDLATIKALAVYIWANANGRYDEPEDVEALFDFDR